MKRKTVSWRSPVGVGSQYPESARQIVLPKEIRIEKPASGGKFSTFFLA